MSGTLYIVGTPIGNLGDMSERALNTLRDVDFIAAEDTRVTMKLLSRFDIHTPLVSYHEHNASSSGERIIERIVAGESCAIVTDAGMPAISDPGEDLVRACHDNGISVASVPGPSAVITALALSGMPTERFSFEGFLSSAAGERRKQLSELAGEKRTLVFYESPHRLSATLIAMADAFGEREIAIVREITKIHEQVWRTTLPEAAEYYSSNAPRGEFVLVVGGASEARREALTLEQAIAIAESYIADGMAPTAAAKRAAAESGVKRALIYRAVAQK